MINQTFVNAVINQEARTENNMKARKGSANALVDLFYKIGASRGKDVTPDFVAAYVADREKALRIALWARDVRGGAGERKIFRDILSYLDKNDRAAAIALANRVSELGRWDDLFVLKNPETRSHAFNLINQALEAGNGLCAKWMPRKGVDAAALRTFLGLSPKRYRKTLVGLTKVVETAMCANDWDNIVFDHVPSVASARYQKAFGRHTPKYGLYVEALKKGEAKITAGAVYPYDVIKSVKLGNQHVAQAQWDALPNYIGDAPVLALVDVSGSMTCHVSGNKNLSCLDVALSLGLYTADKNKGKFKDTFLTFSGEPELLHLKGNLVQKMYQMNASKWEMNTDLHKAFAKILDVAVKGKVPQEEMPGILLILSDMQFDRCVVHDDSAIEMIRRKYDAAGYKIPNVVFWNLNSYDNVPVKFNEQGTALVSGFSPAIMKSILAGKDFNPESIMMETIMKDRYNPGV